MPLYSLDGVSPEVPADGDYWVAPNATVIGKVRLLKGANVWFGAVLRGDTDWLTVGENSNIQDNSVLHTDAGLQLVIGSHVTVGHAVTLHGCTIGDNCIIGMGCTILNRAKIGARSIVGAHALISEDKEFPERSLILGVPAKRAREIPEEQAKTLVIPALSYVERAKLYARGLRKIRD